MDQASASSAASCAHSPVAPRTSSSCSRSADRSQTGVPLPARSGPQSEPHAAPSNKHPSPSPPPSTDSRLRAISCRSFTAAQPHNPAASLRDYCSGAYIGNYIIEEGVMGYIRKATEGAGGRVRFVPIVDKAGNVSWPDKYVRTDLEAIEANKDIPDPSRRKISLQS